ncbi:MAG: hypothetical protein IPI66_14385 [Chitinophagaceae bacterium]|nr:hypothetical protein [Chitinophagaceae bacterium]
MNAFFRPLSMIVLLLAGLPSFAQRLTGTWEGEMSQELLQVNIIFQNNEEICGYTYDYFMTDRKNYCKAYFKGYYNKNQDLWDLNGISFIENSGSHVLMRIKLWKEVQDGETVLIASISSKSSLGFFLGGGIREKAILRCVSSRSQKLPNNMPTCFPEPDKQKDNPIVKNTPDKPKPVDPPVPVKPEPVRKPVDTIAKVKTDTVKAPIVKPVEPEKPKVVVTEPAKEVKERKNVTFSRIPVSEKNILLQVYDNAVIDGDTVSIYYNGKLLVNRKKLTDKAIEINLTLDENTRIHEIVLFAHNLGSIPPNTALIVVTAGDKRYELHSSASLTENAVLVFEYVPK